MSLQSTVTSLPMKVHLVDGEANNLQFLFTTKEAEKIMEIRADGMR